MADYAAAKARITTQQRPDQVLVVNQDDTYCLEIAQKTKAHVLYFSIERAVEEGAYLDDDQLVVVAPGGKSHRLLDLDKFPLFGMHNVSNALAAACAALALGINRKTITAALETFKGAPHRLEHVATINGVQYFNDSKATNIDAMVKAVVSFAEPIHLIAGGRDKDSPFETVRGSIAGRVARAYLIGEAADTIEKSWSPEIECLPCGTMPQALEAATAAAQPGELILLAPGCASFDQFTSYADRGRKFIQWVKEKESLSSSSSSST
jgi:UDP-N-acetylmuramoylalanine--D-glutamate ligase